MLDRAKLTLENVVALTRAEHLTSLSFRFLGLQTEFSYRDRGA